jgi:hypothetical protein
MSVASGLNMSDEQAEQTAKMMQNLDPKTMQRLLAVGTAAQGVVSFARKNKILIGAAVVAVVGVSVSYLARRWGWFGLGSSGEEEFEPVAVMGGDDAYASIGDPWQEEPAF